ncbi:hypothetical protein BJH93_02415 [Kocuria polaris]|nr:hypothetical protein [Kocuria polaris]
MTASSPDTRVCFVGDSFVAGIGDSTGLGWTGRVAVEARTQGIALTAYNLGVRRETSVQIASRLPAETTPRLQPAEDARIILSFGVNDTTVEAGRRRVELSASVDALRSMHADAGRARLLLLGPPAVPDDAQNARLSELNAALRTTASELRIPFVDVFTPTSTDETWQREAKAGDGFHPDTGGYTVLAAIAMSPIIEWLRSPAGA